MIDFKLAVRNLEGSEVYLKKLGKNLSVVRFQKYGHFFANMRFSIHADISNVFKPTGKSVIFRKVPTFFI